ncbi:MAG: GGDEF domain-containing protein [Lysobacterales bacterium]
MPFHTSRFPPSLEAQFRAARIAAQAEINGTTYWFVAGLVMLFSWWDWFVDPTNWKRALVVRTAGAAVVLASGIVQRVSGRPGWAPTIARVRHAAAVLAVAGALAVLKDGYIVGVAGLIAVMLSGPYIAIDRRDLLVLNAVPLFGTVAIMFFAGLDRFAIINASIFIALAVAVSLLLARVFEASNRRAFLLEQQLTREARTDSLTGLNNRRSLEAMAVTEIARSARDDAPLAVVLCDVDHFKRINDRHGHGIGDRAICAVAERLQSVMREGDALGRWGGEEFLAVLPNTSTRDAGAVAERMRSAVEALPISMVPEIRVTVSLGVAGLSGPHSSFGDAWNAIVKAADDAMYRGKTDGRNRVVVAS